MKYAICSRNGQVISIKVKAEDSNVAFFFLSDRNYIPLTGCYNTPDEAIFSFSCAIPLPELTWKQVF